MMERLTCSVCKIKKGKGFVSFISIIKRNDIERLKISEGDGLLLKIENKIFPTIVSRRTTSKNFCYTFSIPSDVGKTLPKLSEFNLLKKSLKIRHYKNKEFDIVSAIPQKTPTGSPIMRFEINGSVLFWIANKGNREILLPRFLNRGKEGIMFELMGAYFCEGRRSRKSEKHHLEVFSFSNAEPSEIEWFADKIKTAFGIKKNEWSMQILHPSPSDYLKKYWSDMGFEASKMKIYRNESVTADKGVAILQIYGTTIAEIFQSLMEFTKIESLKSKEKALSFFRGITRGDIGVSHNKGKMSAVTFTAATESDAAFFIKLCRKLGLEPGESFFTEGKKGFWSVFITGYKNFRILAEMDAFTHQRRSLEFSSGFLKNRNSTVYKYLSAINNGAKTSRDIAEKTEVSIITARMTCRALRNLKYIKGNRPKHPSPVQHELTEKGMSLLKFYDEVNERSLK